MFDEHNAQLLQRYIQRELEKMAEGGGMDPCLKALIDIYGRNLEIVPRENEDE